MSVSTFMCIEKLSRLGFSQKEALVYLMLFRMGPSPVSALAQRVKLKRVTVYAILDALAVRGLVSFVETDQGRRYSPVDPSCLLEQIEAEQQILQSKFKVAQECIEELEQPARVSFSDVQRVSFHRGAACIKKMLQEVFDDLTPLNGLIPHLDGGPLGLCLRELQEVRSLRGAGSVLKKVETGPFFGGALLLQGDLVAFLVQRDELELMTIRDPFYAEYVRQVLFFPYFSKKSVGAMISKHAPVTG